MYVQHGDDPNDAISKKSHLLFGELLLQPFKAQLVQVGELVDLANVGPFLQLELGPRVHDHELRFRFSRTRKYQAERVAHSGVLVNIGERVEHKSRLMLRQFLLQFFKGDVFHQLAIGLQLFGVGIDFQDESPRLFRLAEPESLELGVHSFVNAAHRHGHLRCQIFQKLFNLP